VLEKYSRKTIVAIALAMLAIASFQLSSRPAYSEDLDSFGIEEIYPTKVGGNEWYVNMDAPTSDPNLRNTGNIDFSKNVDGSWRVSADQIRMEAWSPENEQWQNIEITEYAKIEGGSNELLQLYSRGGHHTSRDECLGSAYKARLYGDGRAAWTKEVTHPAYAGNRGEVLATTEPLEDRWVGFKAVFYNFVEDGNTYVRLESYIDDEVTDENGNLVVSNNWKLASVVEDRGGWATDNSDFNPSCGRDRDEILTQPGGTSTKNIAAWRSDDLTWSFKYLSVREIDPYAQPVSEVPTPIDENTEVPTDIEDDVDSICSTEYCKLITSQHYQNTGSIDAVSSIDLNIKKSTTRASGTITVAIVEGNDVLAKNTMSTSDIDTSYTIATTQFVPPAHVGSSFDVVVTYEGSGLVSVSSVALTA
jgi:hypothetical protein